MIDKIKQLLGLSAPASTAKAGAPRSGAAVPAAVPRKPVPRQAGAAAAAAQKQPTAVVPAAGRNVVPLPPSPETIKRISEYPGRVLSASGEKHAFTLPAQQFAAILDDGTFLYGKGHDVRPEVQEAVKILSIAKVQRTSNVAVELSVLRHVYAQHQKKYGGRVLAATTDMQGNLYNIILQAFEAGATDIRIRALHDKASIAMRRLGSYELMPGGDIPQQIAQALIRTAFNNASVSGSNDEPLRPQSAQVSAGVEGSGSFQLPPGILSLRLEFAPLPLGGRHLAIRILPEGRSSNEDIDGFGYAGIHVEQIKRMRRNPSGVILISGPTGHGKSTTLKACLEAIYRYHEGRKNILSVEDPTEYVIENISQIPVWKAKTTEERVEAFTDTIRSVLRLDPDIVMIGEVRDRASAGLAFKAAMSGHLVLTSIHTNNAISIPARLRDEGVEKYKLANEANLVGLVAQRLVQGVCPRCRIPLSSSDDEECQRQHRMLCQLVGPDLAERAMTGKPGGCEDCGGDGYIRRSAIAETIITDQTFLDLITADKIVEAENYWFTHLDGMTMKEHGLAKVLAGKVDPKHVEHEVGFLDKIAKSRISKVVEIARTIDSEHLDRPGLPVARIAEAVA